MTTAQEYLTNIKKELRDYVIPFWMKHSLDTEHGGYFNNLTRDGKVFDPTKHVWLQGRQVWMLSKLYNTKEDFHTEEIKNAAKLGADFLLKHVKRTEDNRVYFSVTRDGKPGSLQRKMFSECFYVMALSEYSRVANESKYWDAAMEVFNSILGWARDPSPLGRSLPSAAPTSPLNVPMIILNVIEEIRNTSDVTKYDRSLFEKDAEWCVEEIKKHYHPEKKLVFELVTSKGELLLDVPEGRLIMPGHAIECGWFLLAFARRNPQFKDSEQLVQMAINMVDWSYEFGWDHEDGGILLIRDSEGYDAVQMEKDNKLWWPHNEAMIAYLMMYQVTKDKKHWERFEQVYKYSFDHFPDHEHGEWYGYLDKQGRVTHHLKGGNYKGCFHVPRALFLSENLLEEIIKEQ